MAAKRFSLLLIIPSKRKRYNWDLREICMVMGKKTIATPLALPLIAALTPDHYDIRIIDEDIERVPDTIHRAGIHIIGPFVVGFDTDTEEEFDRVFEFSQ
jgi:hypothetical protein